MRRLILVLALLSAVTLEAQSVTPLPCSSNCVLQKGQPFSVVYDWAPTTIDPEMADGFKLYQNNVQVSQVSAAALSNGRVSFPFASGLTVSGSYIFNVSAYTSGYETAGDPVSLTILKGKPAKPTNGRLQ